MTAPCEAQIAAVLAEHWSCSMYPEWPEVRYSCGTVVIAPESGTDADLQRAHVAAALAALFAERDAEQPDERCPSMPPGMHPVMQTLAGAQYHRCRHDAGHEPPHANAEGFTWGHATAAEQLDIAALRALVEQSRERGNYAVTLTHTELAALLDAAEEAESMRIQRNSVFRGFKQALAERDAARAEVAVLRDGIERLTGDDHDSISGFVGLVRLNDLRDLLRPDPRQALTPDTPPAEAPTDTQG